MDSFWPACKRHLQGSFDENIFRAFIAPARPARDDNGALRISAPNEASARWLERNIKKTVQQFARAHFGEELSVQFYAEDSAATAPSAAPVASNAAPKPPASAANLRADFTFNNFIIGPANQIAFIAAKSVSEGNADQLSPLLFLYGRTGMGKTHLAHAVGNHYLSLYPNRRGRYVTARDFMNDLVSALRLNQYDRFKHRYEELDLLVVDDIQYIAGDKERTQSEFFFLFNKLHDQNKIIIITSDLAPAQIRDLPARLTTRFSAGFPCHLAPPDAELREAILREKAKQRGAALDDKIIRFLAERIKSNVRELEGALIRVLASSRFLNKPPSLEMCQETLSDLLSSARESVTIETIKKKTAEFFRLPASELSSKRRHQSITRPRQIAMYLCRQMTNFSLPEIGMQFGNREHSTVLHSCRRIENKLKSDSKMQEDVRILEMLIKS
ncbi:MAG: chromosomal replication initiator protein DnaA [Gammaproteobacteria bacterium]